jgi:hypothetical protein
MKGKDIINAALRLSAINTQSGKTKKSHAQRRDALLNAIDAHGISATELYNKTLNKFLDAKVFVDISGETSKSFRAILNNWLLAKDLPITYNHATLNKPCFISSLLVASMYYEVDYKPK